jgi:pimeloyl-ACP methyl ester carboxylesterase
MPTARANGLDLAYETFGDPDDPPLLLVMGLGATLLSWDEDFCLGLVDRGFFVIRFDNRDVGLSTKVEVPADLDVLQTLLAMLGGSEAAGAPYLLTDMAADAVGLLDALDIEAAHVVGASMGGMIAQSMAIEHRARLLSLTSIMSTTGDLDVGQPDPEIVLPLIEPSPPDRAGYIDHAVAQSKLIHSPDHFDEVRVREKAGEVFDRNYYPAGVGHQLLAIYASGSRSDALRDLDINALVIHGNVDRLVNVSGGERTAECLTGSELLILDGMGHDLPPFYWSTVIEAITNLAVRSAANA